MIAALDEVPWNQIGPHSLIITRLSGDRLDRFIYALRDHVNDSVKTIPMDPDSEILVVDEAMMNAMGWIRATP